MAGRKGVLLFLTQLGFRTRCSALVYGSPQGTDLVLNVIDSELSVGAKWPITSIRFKIRNFSSI